MHFLATLLLAAPVIAANVQGLCSPNSGNGKIVPGTKTCIAECSIDRPGGDYRQFKTSCLRECVSKREFHK